MEKLKIAVAFTSTANKNQVKQSESIDSQIATIEAYAEKHGFLVEAYFDNFVFEAKEMLNGVLGFCKGCPDINYLIVSDSTRISRGFHEYAYWKAQFKQAGVEIISVKSDDDWPMAKFMEGIAEMMSQLESESRSEAVRRGLRRKKEQEAKK